MSNFAIDAENLSKQYRIGATKGRYSYNRLTDDLVQFVKSPLAHLKKDERPSIWALKDVSFTLAPGEVVGVIGRNGAGKSTLLKILSRITEPTRGQAILNGRVGSLLEVGVGFHPELTGRENILLSGTIMGMSRSEVAQKFDEIVDFSGIETFIDTPVKRYSSGMYVRLAFAVAAHLDSEILLVDEVLAVGDAAFQKKSLGKMDDVAHQGRTVILISHNMGSIRQLCKRCLWLRDGELAMDSSTPEVVDAYLAWGEEEGARAQTTLPEDSSKIAQIRKARLINSAGEVTSNFSVDEPVKLELTYQIHVPAGGLYGYIQITRTDGIPVLMLYTHDHEPNILDTDLPVGLHTLEIILPRRTLGTGSYIIQSGIGRGLVSTEVIDDAGIICTLSLDDFSTYMGNRRIGFFSTIPEWTLTDSQLTKK